MNNELQIFQSPEFGAVRMTEIEGKPYAIGVDVARALEYAKPSQAIIDHCKGIRKLGIPSGGGIQDTNVIPEGDIYRLIVKAADQSKSQVVKEKAEKFERWVFDEVLPSLRTGKAKLLALPSDYPSALRALADETEKNLALASENEVQRQIIADYAPKVQYVDKILASKGTLAVSQVAADYDMTPQQLNKILHQEHVQHNVNGQWILYREHMGMGYTRSVAIDITRRDGRPDAVSHTQWTQKGRLFIHELLKKRGIMAAIDRKLAGEQLAM